MNYATVRAALHGYGSLRAGERVLIHAAAGGVGTRRSTRESGQGLVHGTASPQTSEAGRSSVWTARSTTAGTAGRDWARMTSCLTRFAALARRSHTLLRPGGRLVGYGFPEYAARRETIDAQVAPHALSMLRGFNLMK